MMRTHRLITTVAVFGAVVTFAGPCNAATFNVSTVAEIQTAFTTAASNGEADTVNIAAGTYYPTNELRYYAAESHSITVTGAGPGQTVIDGSSIQYPDYFAIILGLQPQVTSTPQMTVSGLSVINTNGRGMVVGPGDPVTVFDCEFRDNSSGGLTFNNYFAATIVERCVFTGNTLPSGGTGAGLEITSEGSFFLRNSVFVGNTTGMDGGGGFDGSFDPMAPAVVEIVNNTFFGNTAAGPGGGVSVAVWGSMGSVNISNNIIRGNTSTMGGNDGDDLRVDPGDSPFGLFNNDLGDNANVATGDSEDLKIDNLANYTHAGNIAADPQLSSFHLGPNSPCIDAGNDSAPNLPTTDFEGDLRIVGEHVDIGADELAPVVSFVTTVSELQTALTAAENNGRNDEIQVAPGVYQPAIPLIFTAQPEESFSLTITGAGDGVTIFDGGGVTRIFDLATVNTSGGSDADLVIEDIQFMNGFTTDPAGGAGLILFGADSDIEVRRCSFIGNVSSAGGAGAVGVVTDSGPVRFESVRFFSNTAAGVNGEGGGLSVNSTNGPIWLVNCVFYDNTAGRDGGGATLSTADEMVGVINTTAVENVAAADDPMGIGGGVKVALYGDAAIGILENSIFWSNGSSGSGNDLAVLSDIDGNGVGAIVELAHSVIGIDADPVTGVGTDLLVAPVDNYSTWSVLQLDPVLGPDFHLEPISPCIDAGDDFAPEVPSTDFEGDVRPAGLAVDIGADEYHEPPFFEDGFESGDTSGWDTTVP